MMEHSFKGLKWEYLYKKVNPDKGLINRYGRFLGQLLANRGLKEPPASGGRASYELLPDVEEAAHEILRAVKEDIPIVVFGDYDVDGLTSTALFSKLLKRLGARNFKPVVPERTLGYGLTPEVVKKITSLAPEGLIVALDNATKEVEAVKEALKNGWRVVIFDHHEVGDELPPVPLVNPKRFEENPLGIRELSTVGLVYLFAEYLTTLGYDLEVESFLDLVAVGTVADVAPMGVTNANLVSKGLQLLENGEGSSIALARLIQNLNLRGLNEQDIAFRIAPRLNAFGRMGRARAGLDFLLSEEEGKVLNYLEFMERLNKVRKELSDSATKQLLEIYLKQPAPAFVFYSPRLPKGILGIIAGRLSSVLGIPTVVFSKSEDGTLVGSSRSPEGLNIVEVLSQMEDLMTRWGGHAQAAGLSIRPEKLPEFKERFTSLVERTAFEPPALEIDFPIPPKVLKNSSNLTELLKTLAPFGPGNPQPTFVFDDILLEVEPSRYGYRLTFRDNGSFYVNVEKGQKINRAALIVGRKVRVVYTVQNLSRREFSIVDFKPLV